MKYLVSSNGKQQGPFTIEEINRLFQYRLLAPSDLAWTEGWEAWCPLQNVPGFRTYKSGDSSFQNQLESQGPSNANSSDKTEPLPSTEPNGGDKYTVYIWVAAIAFVVVLFIVLGSSGDHNSRHYNAAGRLAYHLPKIVAGVGLLIGWLYKSFTGSDSSK